MKKIKILFQGDSITDAGRDKRNYHNMGLGYPKFVVEMLSAKYPDVDFEFINFGISGNRTHELFDRLYADCICFQPDVVSILIGVNDEQVQDVIDIIAKHSKKRKQMVPNNSFDVGMYSAFPVEVTVGGATVFVMNVEHFEKV